MKKEQEILNEIKQKGAGTPPYTVWSPSYNLLDPDTGKWVYGSNSQPGRQSDSIRDSVFEYITISRGEVDRTDLQIKTPTRIVDSNRNQIYP